MRLSPLSGRAGGARSDDAMGHDPVLQGTQHGWASRHGMMAVSRHGTASGEPWADSLANEHHVMEVQTAWQWTCTCVHGHFPSGWVLLAADCVRSMDRFLGAHGHLTCARCLITCRWAPRNRNPMPYMTQSARLNQTPVIVGTSAIWRAVAFTISCLLAISPWAPGCGFNLPDGIPCIKFNCNGTSTAWMGDQVVALSFEHIFYGTDEEHVSRWQAAVLNASWGIE